ncbi:YdcF family protein [Massilia sp. CF038]|uniref:YdcF family protein n=1 Tax=Massilia sp. CF038 TaxID=1881045 RepID=UPI000910442A|nr:YdcF family protein [Massilia sp. CF038]SHG42012.1 Uncharacterized SAM-binding protein YcdF, DUF218 family [Massilia sp. CF038]
MTYTDTASTLLRILIMPPANLLLLILLGALLRRKWPALGSSLSAVSVLLLLTLSTNAGALLLVQPLEAMTAPLTSFKDTGAQAIVVLSAGSVERAPEYEGQDVPDQVGLVRLHYGAYLHHATGLPILVSGGMDTSGGREVALGEPMARALREEFKTPVKWVEDKSRTTAENAEYSARMLKAAGVHKVLLVTQAMHMARSREAFVRQGIEVVAAPTLFYSRARWTPWMLIPSANGLYRSYYATHEWVGLYWYRWQQRDAAPVPTPEAPRSST